MPYQVDCECGDCVAVEESAAGSTALCRCGRTIVIPSLRELRRSAGLATPTVSPEMTVEALLLAGKLPEEDHCVLCGVATNASVCCVTECEKTQIDDGRPPWWIYLLSFVSFGWLGVAFAEAQKGEDREWGKERIFRLPLRVCEACQPGLTSPTELRAALDRVPLYRRLLEKFPDAKVFVTSS